jgi:RNA polymerase sigma factor (sigma-70 family)
MTMHLNEDPNLATRHSLLLRITNLQDQEGWKEFFDTYWKLIYQTAIKAGLNDAEAQDAVQDTVMSVMKKLSASKYDRTKGAFKPWLLKLTRWKIVDQFRKRQRGISGARGRRESGTSTRTATIERLPGPGGFEAMWDEEWESNLMDAAIERTKKKVDAKQYQMFDLYFFKSWPVSKVAATLKVSAASVYVARHKIGRVINKEIAYLRSSPY